MTEWDCPFCQIAEDNADDSGNYCVRGNYAPKQDYAQSSDTVQVIVLREHTEKPSTEAMVEAVKLMDGGVGVEIKEVNGHWGMKVSRPDWVQNPKSTTKAGPDGQVYDSIK